MGQSPSSVADANCYWDRYPDIAASPIYGRTVPDGAATHFSKIGVYEGRIWGCQQGIPPPSTSTSTTPQTTIAPPSQIVAGPLPAYIETGGTTIAGCKSQYVVSPLEPKVKFFSREGCLDNQMELAPGEYPDLNLSQFAIKRNDIDAMVVPPNMVVQGWTYPNYQQGTAQWGPGIHADLNAPNKGIGRNDIDSLKIYRRKPWNAYLNDCCFGREDAKGCGDYGDQYGASCRVMVGEYCRKPENFFNETCKGWMQGLSHELKNTIANQVCPTIKDNGTQDQKDWCACYIAQVPPDVTDPILKGIYTCLDPACKSPRSLKPYQMNCPSSLTICKQEDIKTTLAQSEIGRQRLQNECGNINIATQTPTSTSPTSTSPTSTSPTSTSPTSTSTSSSDTGITRTITQATGLSGGVIAGIVIGIIALIIIIILIVVLTSKGK